METGELVGLGEEGKALGTGWQLCQISSGHSRKKEESFLENGEGLWVQRCVSSMGHKAMLFMFLPQLEELLPQAL